MGILADFFAAEPADAERYEALMLDQAVPPEFHAVQYKGLTSLELETLWAIAESRAWSAQEDTLEFIGDDKSDAESWLFRFPERFVDVLAAMSATDLKRAAAEWGATEEIELPAEEVAPILRDLVELAKYARATKRGLYLWGSL